MPCLAVGFLQLLAIFQTVRAKLQPEEVVVKNFSMEGMIMLS